MSAALLAEVTAYIKANGGGEGYYPTPIPGVHVLCSHHEVEANHRLYRPSLCVVVQGSKQFLLGDDVVDYGTMQALVINMELPACGRIASASPDRPFIGITIDFDVTAMREVLAHIDMLPETAETGKSLFVVDVDAPLADCLTRLLRMLAQPKAIPVLSPALMREIYYWLLSGEHVGDIARQAMPDTHMDRIGRAINVLRADFAKTLRVEHLAEAARMSPSSFHQHFKRLTAMTPLQYQKHLRLLEARRLMASDAVNVTEAAYQVGYESASQFSREYSRAFGTAPKRDMLNLRALPMQAAE